MENSDASREEIAGTLTSIPCQLSSADINDFFSLAHYYASKTPQSFRKVHEHHPIWCISLVPRPSLFQCFNVSMGKRARGHEATVHSYEVHSTAAWLILLRISSGMIVKSGHTHTHTHTLVCTYMNTHAHSLQVTSKHFHPHRITTACCLAVVVT